MRGSWAEVLGAIWRRNAGRKRGPGTRGVTAMSDERDRGVEELGPRYPSCRQDRIREKKTLFSPPFGFCLWSLLILAPDSFDPRPLFWLRISPLLLPSHPWAIDSSLASSSYPSFQAYQHFMTDSMPFKYPMPCYFQFVVKLLILMTLAYFLQLWDSFTAA